MRLQRQGIVDLEVSAYVAQLELEQQALATPAVAAAAAAAAVAALAMQQQLEVQAQDRLDGSNGRLAHRSWTSRSWQSMVWVSSHNCPELHCKLLRTGSCNHR
jgi:hypothetical protein